MVNFKILVMQKNRVFWVNFLYFKVYGCGIFLKRHDFNEKFS